MNILYSKNKNNIPKNYALFLDDDINRVPQKLSWIELPFIPYVIVRNYDEFVECITNHNLPHTISWDHDLSFSGYSEYHRTDQSDKTINYNNIPERTGYHAAMWLAEYCIGRNLNIPHYTVHSMNYMGKQNIISVLESAKKIILDK
jgi:hypothetical protein